MLDYMRNRSAWAGIILILFGVLFLAAQLFNVPLFRYGWPLIIAAIGMLFYVGAIAGPRGMGALVIPGTMLLILAAIFQFQALTGYWASWAYVWALIAPAGVGLGMLVWDRIEPHAGLEVGKLLLAIGLLIFVLLGSFFELFVFMIGAPSPARLLWPLGLIVLGLLLLFAKNLFRGLFAGPAAPTVTVKQPPAAPAELPDHAPADER